MWDSFPRANHLHSFDCVNNWNSDVQCRAGSKQRTLTPGVEWPGRFEDKHAELSLTKWIVCRGPRTGFGS